MYAPVMQSIFLQDADPTSIILAAGIFAAFVFILVIGAVSASKSSGRATGRRGGRFTKSKFKRRARSIGLTAAQLKTLFYIISRFKPANPYVLLTNGPLLDSFLKKAMADVESQVASDSIKEAQTLTLFRIKQAIERNSQKSQVINNSRQLKVNQAVTISSDGTTRHNSRIVANLRDVIALQIPFDAANNQIRWKKWSTLSIAFWKPNGEAYSFQTKVTGYNLLKGISCLFVQHSQRITKGQQRRFRRKILEKPSYFYPVRILTTGSGKNQARRAFVETKRGSIGTVIEVSAGGCSIRTSYPLKKGDLIKVEFETERGIPISIFGKVVNSRPAEPLGSIMHVMFTRVSKSSLNKINSFVYDYRPSEVSGE